MTRSEETPMSVLQPHQFTPETLTEHAHAFADANEQYADSGGARFNCIRATGAFIDHLGPEHDAHPERKSGNRGIHEYALVHTTKGLYAVDHTARQYDAEQAYPTVLPARKHRAWVNKALR